MLYPDTKKCIEDTNFAEFYRLPIDWRSPLGYLVVMASVQIEVFYMMLIAACVIALGVGAYLYVVASCKCIKGSLFAIGRSGNRNNFFDQFNEFIQFHTRVKQLSRKWCAISNLQTALTKGVSIFHRWISMYAGIIQAFISILFVWSLVTISGELLMLQIQIVKC